MYTEERTCDIHLAVGNEGDAIVICDKNKNVTYQFYKKIDGKIILTKLNNYISFLTTKNLVLIKIDVEGGEGKAIESGIELITKYHVPFIFMEFTPVYLKLHDTEPRQFLQLFIDNGYKISISNFFENYLCIDDILRNTIEISNLYIIYSKILK